MNVANVKMQVYMKMAEQIVKVVARVSLESSAYEVAYLDKSECYKAPYLQLRYALIVSGGLSFAFYLIIAAANFRKDGKHHLGEVLIRWDPTLRVSVYHLALDLHMF